MNNKRAVALLLGLMVVIVLAILSSSFFIRSINENNLVRRYVNSVRAFWFAEDGLSRAIAQLPSTASLGSSSSIYETWTYPVGNMYRIVSVGRVIVDDATVSQRQIEVFAEYTPPSGFNYAIEVNGDLKLTGSYEILPDDQPDSYYYKENANVSFEGRFGIPSSELKNLAISQGHYYENPGTALPSVYNQVTWVKITDPGDALKLPKTGWGGSGILVVEGNAQMEGGTFDGLMWVIGELTITGNGTINGSVVSECGVDVTTKVSGTPTLEWDSSQINMALGFLGPLGVGTRSVKSWREI